MDSFSFGKQIIFIGIFFLLTGLCIMGLSKFNVNLGKLPGDIVIKNQNTSFYFPLTTCLIISVVISLISKLFFKR